MQMLYLLSTSLPQLECLQERAEPCTQPRTAPIQAAALTSTTFSAAVARTELWLQLKPGRGHPGAGGTRSARLLGSWLMSCAVRVPIEAGSQGATLLTLLPASWGQVPASPSPPNDQGPGGGPRAWSRRAPGPFSSPLIVQEGAGHGQGAGTPMVQCPLRHSPRMLFNGHAGEHPSQLPRKTHLPATRRLPRLGPQNCPHPGNSWLAAASSMRMLVAPHGDDEDLVVA